MSDRSGTGLRIVTLAPEHLDQVVAIEAATYPEPWGRSLFEGELSRGGRAYLAAVDGDRVLGYAGVLLLVDEGHVATVVVRPDEQARGIGTRLVHQLVVEALALGAVDLTLEVRIGDHRTQAIYRRFGFVPAGVRPRYYPDGQDALIMWVHDVQEPAYRTRLDAVEADLVPARVEVRAPAPAAVAAPSDHPALVHRGVGREERP